MAFAGIDGVGEVVEQIGEAVTGVLPRKKIERQPTVLLGLREHIDAMLEANPAITAAAIWQRLHDEHDATPSYPAVRTSITIRRTTRPQPPRVIDEPPAALATGRPANDPPVAATEEAIARLLHLAFLEIRFLTATPLLPPVAHREAEQPPDLNPGRPVRPCLKGDVACGW